MNISVNQTTSLQEVINNNILTKLHDTFVENKSVSDTYSLSGNLYSAKGYKVYADELTENYPNLVITIPQEGQYIKFADPEVERVLLANNFSSDGVGISKTDAESKTSFGNIFKSNTTITSFNELELFNRITSIGGQAFANCSNLTSVTIPNSVTSTGNDTFRYCSGLTSVTIPNSMVSIGGGTFSGCSSLTLVNIPNSVTSIGGSVFENCSGLTSVTIPNSVTSIGSYAFYQCSSLTSLIFPDSIQEINGTHMCSGCSNLESIKLPNSMTSIDYAFFQSCSKLTEIDIPDSVTNIGLYAFRGTNGLSRVYISSIELWFNITINNNSPDNSSSPLVNLRKLYLKSDRDTEIRDIIIPNTITKIKKYVCCNWSRLTSITIPNTVTEIGDYSFYNCTGLTSITIPDSVQVIKSSAFNGCTNLTAVHITDLEAWCNISFSSGASSPLSLAKHLYLNGNEIINLTIPNSINQIKDYTFYEARSITSVVMHNNITSIGDSSFRSCKGLTTITIPSSVTSIGNYSFNGCSNIVEFIVEATTPPTLGTDALTSMNTNLIIYVPASAVSDYQSASGWSSYASKIQAIPTT